MRQYRSFSSLLWIAISYGLLLLQGCGVTIESKRIAAPEGGGKLPFVIPGQGITTYLVRTRFDLIQPVSWTPASTTPTGDIFDICLRTCNDTKNSPEKTKDVCEIKKPDARISLARPSIRSVTVPDLSRAYQTTVSADPFRTGNVTISSAANGTIEEVSTKTSTVAFDVLASVAKVGLGVATSGVLRDFTYIRGRAPISPELEALLGKAAIPSPAPACSDLPGVIKQNEESTNPARLSCEQAKAIQACIARDAGPSVQQEQAARDRLYDKAVERKLDPQLLTAAAANRTERISSAQTRLNAARSYYRVNTKKVDPVLFSMVKILKGPDEFMARTEVADFENLSKAGSNPWSIETQQDISALDLMHVAEKLEEQKRRFTVQTKLPEGLAQQVRSQELAEAESRLGLGYRYRLPVTAATTVDVTKLNATDPSAIVDSVKIEGIVAQYGPLAAMPSRFNGKSGRIHLKLWPDSGGIQTAELESEGVDAGTINSVLEKYEAESKARAKAQEAAAYRAGGSNPENEALRREKEKRQLLKDIRELSTDGF